MLKRAGHFSYLSTFYISQLSYNVQNQLKLLITLFLITIPNYFTGSYVMSSLSVIAILSRAWFSTLCTSPLLSVILSSSINTTLFYL
ncbi:hypothetical protein CSPAE12_01863 [Colletotrichum incanum]|nr:hypothetical protein CSPAE12_01863 [Colletotrichum incanum]